MFKAARDRAPHGMLEREVALLRIGAAEIDVIEWRWIERKWTERKWIERRLPCRRSGVGSAGTPPAEARRFRAPRPAGAAAARGRYRICEGRYERVLLERRASLIRHDY
jgi:hypothetical protein